MWNTVITVTLSHRYPSGYDNNDDDNSSVYTNYIRNYQYYRSRFTDSTNDNDNNNKRVIMIMIIITIIVIKLITLTIMII